MSVRARSGSKNWTVSLRILSATIRIDGGRGTDFLLDRISRRFSEFVQSDDVTPDVVANVAQVSEGWRVAVNGREQVFHFRFEWPNVEELIKLLVVQAHPEYVFLHSSAVGFDTGAALLVGGSTSGKTTLAARLCQDGGVLLSDDMAPLDCLQGLVHEFRMTPSHRPHTRHLAIQKGWTNGFASDASESAFRIRWIFLLNVNDDAWGETYPDGMTVRSLSEPLREWQNMLQLLGIRRQDRSIPSNTDLTVRSPAYFARPPVLESIESSRALRLFCAHLHAPTPAPARLLPLATALIGSIQAFSLSIGNLDRSAEEIQRTCNNHRS